ncbi:MAG: hypothetical protein ACOX15_08390 [Tepidanaerobacteraceae bacterium]|jgi:CRISPR/Cas system CMR-associated protein Cmr5 small subunit
MYKNDNIDALINELGFNIVENIKKYDKVRNALRSHIDKALGVLVNDGVYAYYLFCKSKEKEDDKVKPYSKIFISDIVNKFKEYFNKNNNDSNASHKQNDYDEERHFFQNISQELHELLFFREVLERVLIYARYHAKALSGDKNE